jgi:signal transduction histidine kinase
MGSGAALLLSKFPLTPINNLVNAMNRLAAGDYNVRLDFKGPFYNNSTFKEISTSFNRMAQELENTEMLRSDFVNNFSHEFKTPIVSITGFAKLLRRAALSDEERNQYLGVIESESLRLSRMATNVLNLTKIENQSILGDTRRYNLSEQIRSSLLMLEPKWSAKNIEVEPDFDEYEIDASEELLKEVFINLLDNAIKFSPEGGTVGIRINESGEQLEITVSNTGPEIPEEKRERIFGKFYQADESHSGLGNGVGLAIVKRVVDLHGGSVWVSCDSGVTTFTVSLPKMRK